MLRILFLFFTHLPIEKRLDSLAVECVTVITTSKCFSTREDQSAFRQILPTKKKKKPFLNYGLANIKQQAVSRMTASVSLRNKGKVT